MGAVDGCRFEELVKQHCVHLVVTNRVGLSIFAAHHQVRVYFFNFLRHEAKLRDALGIDLFLVAEADWLEGEDRFACLVHWLDVLLKAL